MTKNAAISIVPSTDAQDLTQQFSDLGSPNASKRVSWIRCLPVELLAPIINDTLPSPADIDSKEQAKLTHNYYHLLAQRMLVCRRWTAVIRNTPIFWTWLSNIMPHDHLELVLSRSSGHPLHIIYIAPGELPSGAFGGIPCFQFIKILTPHLARWHTASLWLPDAFFDTTPESIEAPAPRLQTLSVLNANPGILRPGLKLRAENLKNVSLFGIALDWSNVPLAGLAKFRLESLQHPIQSIELIVRIIRDSPGLTYLSLQELEFASCELSPETVRALPCRALKSLAVDLVQPDAFRSLMAAIASLPVLTSLLLNCHLHNLTATEYLSGLDHLEPDLQRLLSLKPNQTHTMTIRAANPGRHFYAEVIAPEYALLFLLFMVGPPEGIETREVARWLATLLSGRTRAVPISLNIYGNALLTSGREFLGALSEITEELELSPQEWLGWLSYLCNPTIDSTRRTLTWAFPNLRRLRAHFNDFLGLKHYDYAFTDALGERYSEEHVAYKKRYKGWDVQRPRRLQKFEASGFEDISAEKLNEMQDILGEGVLTEVEE